MSFAAVKLTPLRASRALQLSRPAAALHISPIRAGLNESDQGALAIRSRTPAGLLTQVNDEDRPQLAEHLELSKKESVTKREWKPELASNSEQAVRQEKHSMTFEEMQHPAPRISAIGRNGNPFPEQISTSVVAAALSGCFAGCRWLICEPVRG